MKTLISSILNDNKYVPKKDKKVESAVKLGLLRLDSMGYYQVTFLGKAFLDWPSSLPKMTSFL